LLLIAPTGVYYGRVKRGIDTILASETQADRTRVRVVLIVGQEWLRTEPGYAAKFVDPLRDHIVKTWRDELGLDIICDQVDLPMEKEENLTGYLLKELFNFFEVCRTKQEEEAEAYIDLTSAPKEWQFAAISVSNFFPNLELYYVKPEHGKSTVEYRPEEVSDQGLPKVETVRAGEPRPPLPRWMEPRDARGSPNLHHALFQTIFELAREKAADPSKVQALSDVLVPIEQEPGLREYRKRFPADLDGETRSKLQVDEALQRHISRLLTDVSPYRLFDRRAKSVKMTLRGAMLGEALFKQ
jgi:hypothetical protein